MKIEKKIMMSIEEFVEEFVEELVEVNQLYHFGLPKLWCRLSGRYKFGSNRDLSTELTRLLYRYQIPSSSYRRPNKRKAKELKTGLIRVLYRVEGKWKYEIIKSKK